MQGNGLFEPYHLMQCRAAGHRASGRREDAHVSLQLSRYSPDALGCQVLMVQHASPESVTGGSAQTPFKFVITVPPIVIRWPMPPFLMQYCWPRAMGKKVRDATASLPGALTSVFIWPAGRSVVVGRGHPASKTALRPKLLQTCCVPTGPISTQVQ